MTDRSMAVLAHLNDGLVRALTLHGGQQLWCRAKLRGQKRARKCYVCDCALSAGNVAWHEITASATNRADRICDPCMQREIQNRREGR